MELPITDNRGYKGGALKYADSIDLSNACRAFYQTRLESTRKLKDLWPNVRETGSNNAASGDTSEATVGSSTDEKRCSKGTRASLNFAISVLRREIVSLISTYLDICT